MIRTLQSVTLILMVVSLALWATTGWHHAQPVAVATIILAAILGFGARR